MIEAGLNNVEMQSLLKTPFGPDKVTWKQVAMSMFGDVERKYWSAKYAKSGDSNHYSVFFAVEKFDRDGLPSSFSTSGFNKNGCKLHFGYTENGTDKKSLFFVVHPNSWGPYQKRFRELCGKTDREFQAFVAALGKGGNLAAGAAAGSLAAWYGVAVAAGPAGWAVAGVATVGGIVAGDLADRLTGDYLRYIG